MKRFFDRIFPSMERQEGPSHADGPSGAAAGRVCPECGAGASPVQDWCLECGSRIEDTATRWHQPAAVMASVALIFLAGLVLALSEVAKDAEIAKAKTVRKMVAAVPPAEPQVPDVPTPQGGPAPTLAPPKTSKNDTDDSGPAPAASPSDSGSSAGAADPSAAAVPSTGAGTYVAPAPTPSAPEPVAEWPAEKKAWTVVLFSTTRKADAEKFARKAKKKGVEAGILDGSKYKNFTEGLWLVWAGRFKTQEEALKASDGYAKKGFEGETTDYVREKAADEEPAKGKKDDGNDGTSRNGGTPTAPTGDGG